MPNRSRPHALACALAFPSLALATLAHAEPAPSRLTFDVAAVESACRVRGVGDDGPLLVRRGCTVPARVPAVLAGVDVHPGRLSFELRAPGEAPIALTHTLDGRVPAGAETWRFLERLELPPDAPVGAYTLVTMSGSGKKRVDLDARPLYVLFNPYDPRSDTFIPPEGAAGAASAADELENELGAVWQDGAPQPWSFGQRDPFVVAYVLDRVATLPLEVRRDAWRVARELSWRANDNVLHGRWDGEYSDGKQPGTWTSSSAVLRAWDKGARVKYGQCWVFSAVTTTVGRTLGIPTRSVTNLDSAHEKSGADVGPNHCLTRHLAGGDGSIWNFHVWNEAWYARPGETAATWNALDATPQEASVPPGSPFSPTALSGVHVATNDGWKPAPSTATWDGPAAAFVSARKGEGIWNFHVWTEAWVARGGAASGPTCADRCATLGERCLDGTCAATRAPGPFTVAEAQGIPGGGASWTSAKAKPGYTYMFWLRPDGVRSTRANVLTKGGPKGTRGPSVWMQPGSTRLHVSSGPLPGDTADALNTRRLAPARWTHVAVVAGAGRMEVYLDGQPEGSVAVDPSPEVDGALWASRPGSEAAAASVAELRAFSRPLDAREVVALAGLPPGAIDAETGGHAVSADGGATLDVPPGALSADTVVEITRVDVPRVDVERLSPVYDFSPDGLKFASPATVCLAAKAPPTDRGSCLGYLDETAEPPRWRCEDACLAQVSPSFWCGRTTHFTNFAVLLDGRGGSKSCGGDGDFLIRADSGGTATSTDGRASVTFPKGALALDTLVGVHHVEKPVVEAPRLSEVYDFSPGGLSLAAPATVCLKPLRDPGDAGTCLGYIDESADPPQWKCQDPCLKASDTGTLCGTTDHFTNFAVLLSGGPRDTSCASTR